MGTRLGHAPRHPPAKTGGETSPAQGETQQPAPRLPHERDESSDEQAARHPSMERVGRQAHADLERGVADTSRSVETDATYHRLRGEAQPGEAGTPISPPARPASRR